MKKVFLLLSFCLFSISTFCFAQNKITGIYSTNRISENMKCKGISSTNIFGDNIDCNIYLFKSGNYYIELSDNVTSDIIDSYILSYGKFSLKNKELTLNDRVHNYKMKLIVGNKTLTVKHAFGFLINKKFIYYDSNPDLELPVSKINVTRIQKEREIYKKTYKTLFPLSFGVYKNEETFQFKLNIQKNNKYKLEFRNIILSEGNWSRNGNELVLRDLILNHSFYALIKNRKLISKLLPGDNVGCVLIKK